MNKSNWKILARFGATPDNLSVGRSLYLRGTGVTELLKDDRGYRLDRAGGRYIAWRRNFSASEALGHWGAGSYPDRERGDAFVAAVRKEEARRNGGASQ